MAGRCGSARKLRNLFAYVENVAAASPRVIEQTKRITLLGRHGHPDKALELFDQMPQRTQVSWNAMLSVLINAGRLDSALQLFDEMPHKNPTTYTSMIVGLSNSGIVSRAREIFDTVAPSAHNVFSWTAMITCYARNDEALNAIKLFRDLYSEFFDLKILPNSHTFSVLLKSYVSIRSFAVAMQIQSSLIKLLEEDSECSVFVRNSLVDVHAKLGSLADAEKVFDRMKRKDIGSWNTMMDAYTHHLLIDKALGVFDRIREKDTLSWNIVMSGLSSVGRGDESFEFFIRLMRREDETAPNSSTYTIIFAACAAMTMLEFGRQVHACTLKINWYQSNVFICNSLIFMYASCGSVQESEQVFVEMPQRDIVSWNSIIQGLGQNGCSTRALELAKRALASKNFNHNTFTAILTACSHGGLVDEGLEYFNSMHEVFGIEPSLDQYICMVDMMGRAGRVEEALEFLQSMPFRASSVAWQVLLNACVTHGSIDVGRIAAQKVVILEPGNVRGYHALARIYLRAGRVEESKRMIELMRDKDLRKDTGFSWIIEKL